MSKIKGLKYIYWALGSFVLVVAFNNCGEGFFVPELDNGGSFVLFSQAPGQSCEDALLKVYEHTYYPFVTQTCSGCHVSGPGTGTFASLDLQASFTSLTSIGVNIINSQAIDDKHKPPYTGLQNIDRIKELKSYWNAAKTKYELCLTDSGEGLSKFVVKTNGSVVTADLTTTFVRMEWDLETQSNSKSPLVAGIEIRQAVFNNIILGYEFRNPTLRLKTTTSGSYQTGTLNIYINDQLQSEATTYNNLDVTIAKITDINLAPSAASAFTIVTPAGTDTIALEFSSLIPTSEIKNPTMGSPPAPPVITPTPTVKVTYTELVASGGLFANNCISCHNSNNARGSLDLTNYTAAKTAATNIMSRVNNANNPMPTGGLLPPVQRDAITAWVSQGALQ